MQCPSLRLFIRPLLCTGYRATSSKLRDETNPQRHGTRRPTWGVQSGHWWKEGTLMYITYQDAIARLNAEAITRLGLTHLLTQDPTTFVEQVNTSSCGS